MARIGIYGGSFNPPHIGHIRAAETAVEALKLDKLILIPAGVAPHKEEEPGSPTAFQRLEMVKLAAAPNMEVSDMELKRQGKSYTYLTVEALRQQYPKDDLILLMGTDMFLSFDTWKNPGRITKEATLGVFYRGESNERAAIDMRKKAMEAEGIRVELVKNPVVDISSTQLRRMLIMGCATPFLPEKVADYIVQNKLYGTGKEYTGLSETELEQVVVRLLKPNRVAHVLGCRDTARQLARIHGADETNAVRAALLHDVTKALDGPLQLTLCSEYSIILDVFGSRNPKTLHALTGSLVAQRIFGENDRVVSAIRSHTTGKPGMNTLEKIIYVADYMEPNRDFPGVQELRKLAFSDLDAAMQLGLEMTLSLLHKQGREISPESQRALDYYKEKRSQKEGTVC